MKKLIPFLVLLVGITGALAQGTVDFNNNRTYQTAADRLVYNVDGSRLVGTNYAAEMYVRSTTGSLTPVIGGAARFRVTTTGSPGTWSGGTRTIPGFLAGETVTLVIRAWESTSDLTRSYDQAQAGNFAWGQSDPFSYTIPASGAPANAFFLENFRTFTLVPEPSVIGLGLIGIGALFMLRRRKA